MITAVVVLSLRSCANQCGLSLQTLARSPSSHCMFSFLWPKPTEPNEDLSASSSFSQRTAGKGKEEEGEGKESKRGRESEGEKDGEKRRESDDESVRKKQKRKTRHF